VKSVLKHSDVGHGDSRDGYFGLCPSCEGKEPIGIFGSCDRAS
jgi:hypothetical protein